MNFDPLLSYYSSPEEELLNKFESLSRFGERLTSGPNDLTSSPILQALFAQRVVNELSFNTYPSTLPYMATLRKAQTFFNSKKLAQYTPSELCKVIREINGSLIQADGLESQYRTHLILIFDTRIYPKISSRDSFLAFEKKLFPLISEEEKEIWKNQTRRKVWMNDFTEKKRETMCIDDQDALVLKYFCEIKNNHHKIPQLMDQFAEQLIEEMKTIKDPYEAMSKTHQRFVHIHPFIDGNGRTARILMIWIAKEFGVEPLFMGSEDSYTTAVKDGEEAFTAYLKDRAKNAPKVTPFLRQTIERIVKDTLLNSSQQ